MDKIKTLQCIKAANLAKTASAQCRLDDLKNNGIPSFNPLSGFFKRGITWRKAPNKRVFQLLSLIIAVVFYALATPIMYLFHILGVYKQKRPLRAIIKNTSVSNETDITGINNLEDLWALYERSDYILTRDEEISLINNWLEILTGEKKR